MQRTTIPVREGLSGGPASDFFHLAPVALPRSSVSVREERRRAFKVMQDALNVMTRAIERVRQGREVEVEAVQGIAERIIESVKRNPDALRSLGSVRHVDRYTFEHSVSVAILASSFGLALDLSSDEILELALAGLLHDVGKALTPLTVLNKPGPLDSGEVTVMRRHVADTRQVLEKTKLPPSVVRAAAEHHERRDGSGYPSGLAGDAIGLFGQVIGICDVYDAVTGDRVYRRGETPTAVLRILLSAAGKEFDSILVHRFIQTMGIFPVGSLVRLESGRLAVVIERGERDLLRPLVRVFYDTSTMSYVSPADLDLSAASAADSIRSAELPARWGVKSHLYMD